MADMNMYPRRWKWMQWSVVCIQNRRCLQPHRDACLAKDILFLSNEEVLEMMDLFLLREKIKKSILTDELKIFFEAALAGQNLRDGEVAITVGT